MSCCKICLNDMCQGGCCNTDYKSLTDIAYSLKVSLASIGTNYANRLKEGFSCSPSDFDFYNIESIGREKLSKSGDLILQYKKQRQLLDAVEKEIKNIYNGIDSCICTESLCKIKDDALGVVSFNCFGACRADLMISSAGETAWIEANPYCVSRENYEALLYRICDDLKFDLKIVDFDKIKTKCNIVYDIVKEYQNCEIDFTIDKTEQDCKIDYNLLRTTKDCKITYTVFRELLDCGITFNTIATAIDCGITFDINKEDKCPMIVTLTDRYSLCGDNPEQDLKNLIYTFSLP